MGNIGNVGFKGEVIYFLLMEEEGIFVFMMVLGVDYVFFNFFYFNVGYLYNESGFSNVGVGGFFNF